MEAYRQVSALLVSLGICCMALVVGGTFTPGEWYQALQKPEWNPPNSVFGPVWTLLYILMGVAAWLVWRRSSQKPVALALGVYAAQLVLNALWSFIFFGLHLMGLAALEIALLWVFILATILLFWRIHRLAALMLVPYLAWVSFATLLNVAIWRLNS